MLAKSDIRHFLDTFVCVGVPSDNNYNKLFYHYGIIKTIDKNEITLRTKNGFVIIPMKKIKKISKTRQK